MNGLKALRETCDLELVTDSQYLKQGVTQYWARWKTNGWRTASTVLALSHSTRFAAVPCLLPPCMKPDISTLHKPDILVSL